MELTCNSTGQEWNLHWDEESDLNAVEYSGSLKRTRGKTMYNRFKFVEVRNNANLLVWT